MSDIRLIGFGTCGANIVSQFKSYEGYSLSYVDNEKHEFDDGIILEKFDNVDGFAHEKYDQTDVEWLGLEGNCREALVFVSGASDVSGAILQALEHLKRAQCEVTVCYIRPELRFCTDLQKTQDKISFNILQEYARSGCVRDLLIFDNSVLGIVAGKSTIADYFAKINAKIASFVHSFNYCRKNKPIFGQRNNFLDITRISCLGYGGLDEPIVLFYDLKSTSPDGEIIFPLEIQYYFLVPSERIENDQELMTDILQIVEKEEQKYKSISYGVYEISSEQEEVTVLVYLRTSRVQTAD